MGYEYLQQSPVRQVLKTCQNELSIFESEKIDYKETDGIQKERTYTRILLNDIEIILKNIETHWKDKLRIAVLGEVKAGKSTFINTCVKKEIAYTDVLEATAIVSEITYAEEEYARIIDKKGKITVECDFEELLELMEEKTEELDYFKDLDKIEIGVNNEVLKDIILVDTPGLLSITAENQYVTSAYVYQADYIFWVINCNNLGDKAVNDKLNELKTMGKPMIGIINQVDTQEIKNEIEGYIQENYENIFEELFFVSSKRAWRGIVNGNSDDLQESGFNSVMEYLGNLSEDAEGVKEDSNSSSEFYQLKREYGLHNRIINDLEIKKKYYDNEQHTIKEINHEIKTEINIRLKTWIEKELYLSEKTEMLNSYGEKLKNCYKEYSTTEYITYLVNKKYTELVNDINDKWTTVQKQWLLTPSKVQVDFEFQGSLDTQSKETPASFEEKKKTGMIEGMKTGAKIGAVFAGYIAWLGPAAATITIGSALVSVALPMAISGGIIGMKAINVNTKAMEENAEKKEKEINILYNQVVSCVNSKVKQIEKELYKFTDQYSEELCNSMKEI